MANDITLKEVEKAIEQFDFNGGLVGYKLIRSGNINDTLDLKTEGGHYILQRLNTYVYKKPKEVMTNIDRITNHIKDKIILRGGNPELEVLQVCHAKDGLPYSVDEHDNFWRGFKFIEGFAYDVTPNKEAFKEGAIAFGRFQKDLGDFPVEEMYYTIPNFHNTPHRYEVFEQSVKEDIKGRAKNAPDLIELVRKYSYLAHAYDEAIESGEMPLRVTHNDTKLNNVMLDKVTHEPLCVLDLDTVMPGYAVNDFGDAIRSGTSTASKTEQDKTKIHIKLDYFKAYLEGFLSKTLHTLSKAEIELLPTSCLVMTYELGMRYLTDYLQGDPYFKVSSENQNLIKARNQLYFLEDMALHENEMKDILHEVLKGLGE